MYSIKDGWEPLCEFLEKDVPNKPFPHRNIDGKDRAPDMDKHPLGKQIQKELIVSASLLVVFIAAAAYFYFTLS